MTAANQPVHQPRYCALPGCTSRVPHPARWPDKPRYCCNQHAQKAGRLRRRAARLQGGGAA